MQKNHYIFANLETIYSALAAIKTYMALFNLHGYWVAHLSFGRPTFLLPAPPSPYTMLAMHVSFIRKNSYVQLGLLYTIIPLKLDTNLMLSLFIYFPDGHKI